MIITYSSHFHLHEERSGIFTIRVRVTLHGQRPVDFSIGCSLDSREHWDSVRQRVASSHRKAMDYNRRISECDSCIRDLMARFEHVEKRTPTREDVRNALSDAFGRSMKRSTASDDIGSVIDKFMAKNGMQNQWSDATYKKFRTLKEHILDYRRDTKISDIDNDYLVGFVNHLIHKDGLRNTSVAKTVSFIRWVLRWAAENGLYEGDSHRTFKPKLKGSHFEQKEVIYLTIDELKRIESFPFDDSSTISTVRDVFVFCCYSGLRFSDAAKLKRDDVHDTYIDVVTKKTDDRLRIELNSHTSRILQKYEGLKGGKALPAISNQKSNDYLKDIGRECGIDEPVRIVFFRGSERIEEVHPKWELLTTHVARRTFVVTALQLGIPAEVIIRWTGHSDYKAMKPYIAIVDDLKARNMSKFDGI